MTTWRDSAESALEPPALKFEFRCRETFAYFAVDITDYDPKNKAIRIQYLNNWQEPFWLTPEEIDGKLHYPVRPAPEPHDPEQWDPKEQDRIEAQARSEENEPFSWW